MIETATQASLFLVLPEASQCEAIKSALPDVYAESVFTDLPSMMTALKSSPPQLLLCQQTLFEAPEAMSLSALAAECGTQTRIMVLGPSRPISIQIEALKQGSRGYFNEDLPLDKLHEALQLVLHGEVWVERYVISGLIDELTHTPSISDEQKQALDSLSAKELEVAKLVSHGATNKMIARQLNITERTVKAHLTSIFHKMDLKDRLSLAIFFRDLR